MRFCPRKTEHIEMLQDFVILGILRGIKKFIYTNSAEVNELRISPTYFHSAESQDVLIDLFLILYVL